MYFGGISLVLYVCGVVCFIFCNIEKRTCVCVRVRESGDSSRFESISPYESIRVLVTVTVRTENGGRSPLLSLFRICFVHALFFVVRRCASLCAM